MPHRVCARILGPAAAASTRSRRDSMEPQDVLAFAQHWIQAWKDRDVEALLAHYTDDVEFHSLLAVKLLGDASGTVVGRQKLGEYFRKALALFPGELDIE